MRKYILPATVFYFLTVTFILLGTPTKADPNNLPYVPSCMEQDFLGIADDGPEKAIITYSNSIDACSPEVTVILTAPNGISVKVQIIIGKSEKIILVPTDPNFMSFPPEADIPDGEKMQFQIMGGLS